MQSGDMFGSLLFTDTWENDFFFLMYLTHVNAVGNQLLTHFIENISVHSVNGNHSNLTFRQKKISTFFQNENRTNTHHT